MSNRNYLAEIEEHGLAVIPGVLNLSELSHLTEELELAIRQDLAKLEAKDSTIRPSDRWMVHNCMVRGKALAKLIENPTMHEYLSAILGSTCIMYAYQSSSMPSNETNYSFRIHVDSPRFIPGYVTNLGVIFALNDFTESNGATYFLRGSHLSDRVPSESEFFSNAFRATCKAGDMIIFNARVWHSGGKNFTDSPRHSLTINVCRSYMRQRFDFPRMIDSHFPEVLSWVGTKGRQFLGYDVRVPTCLEEFYLPEHLRLYKSNQG